MSARRVSVENGGAMTAGRTVARLRLSVVREERTPWDPSTDEAPTLAQPESVAAWLWRHVMADEPREVMVAVYLDARNRLIGYTVAYAGGLTQASVEPRGILVPALLANAYGVIVAHNHPSGSIEPSAQDYAFTARLRDAGEIVGVKVLDHLVIGAERRFTSIRRSGGF